METKVEVRPGRIISLNVYENPNSQTTAFFIHGLGGRSEQWRNQVEFLKQKYTLVIPDLFGHGKSDKPEINGANPYSFKEFALDLQALFNRYANKQNIVFGHSYGAAMATALTYQNREHVNKLVLLTPTVCSPDISISFIYHLPNFLMSLLRPLIEIAFVKASFAKNTDRKLIEEEMEASKINPIHVIAGCIKGMKDIERIDVSQINIPTLIVFGKYDRLIPPKVPTKFYGVMPNHKMMMIEDAAHLIQLEQPQEVDAIIQNFLS